MMKTIRHILLAVAGLLLASRPCLADVPIRIVTTTSVLADISKEIGGNHVEVFYIASPKRDLHKVSPTPKDILKTKKADVFIYHGLQAEPWLLPLLNASGRRDFMKADGQAIDASLNVTPLEVPDTMSRLEGDVHPLGNPHYWLNPAHGKIMAENILQSLSRIYPNHDEYFQARNDDFQKKLDAKLFDWSRRMEPFHGTAIVTYHRSWSYFAKAYQLKVIGEIEPKPGIPVTSKHLSQLQTLMKRENARVIVTEPYQSDKPSKRLAKQTGAEVVEFLQFNDVKKGVNSYLDLIEHNIKQIEKVLSGVSHG